MNTNYQYIIISTGGDRKKITNELLNKVNTSKAPIYNLQATTISDNDPFLDCIKDSFTEYEKKVVCCIKSHFRALEYASLFNSPEFTIILEDDVTFIKDNFSNIIDELINKLKNNSKYSNIGIFHIGYIIDNSYDKFIESPPFEKLEIDNSYGFYNSFYAFGAQCYIIRKSELQKQKIINLIHSRTFYKCHEIVSTYFNSTHKIIGIDHIINRVFDFNLLYPPIVIERDEISTIGNNNKHFWEEYFNKFPEKKHNYL